MCGEEQTWIRTEAKDRDYGPGLRLERNAPDRTGLGSFGWLLASRFVTVLVRRCSKTLSDLDINCTKAFWLATRSGG